MELKTKLVHTRVPESVWKQVEELAASMAVPSSQIIRWALTEWMEKNRG